ncbi:MAG: cupin [Nitrososphaeraceae archaeon]|nr:cupin [Nitrososphaeraceae archaeon]
MFLLYIFILFNLMEKQNLNIAKEKTVSENYFRGEVVIREVLNEESSLEQEMYHVLFKNGAITNIHYHESEQILICTNGIGIVGLLCNDTNLIEFKTSNIESIKILNEDDVVCIPKNRLHFHGSLNKNDFSHIAIRRKHIIDNNTERYASTIWEIDLLNNLLKYDNSKINMTRLRIWEIINSEIQKCID